MNRRIPAILAAGLLLGSQGLGVAQTTTVTEDMKAAVIAYAEAQKTAFVKDQSKAAIISLYKKLYGSGANKTLVRTLGTVALNADEINTLAENAANAIVSGAPESVMAASSQVAIALGQTLTKGIEDPKLRRQLAGALGKVDKINEIADVLGQAAGGDSTAAQEYVGRALIAMTPAAGIFTAVEVATGTMKYAKGKFVDGELEGLYQQYLRDGRDGPEKVRGQLETLGGYAYLIRDRRPEIEGEKAAAISKASLEPSERVREHLTRTTEKEVIDDILERFAARLVQEKKRAEATTAAEQAEAEATVVLDALDWACRTGYGEDWTSKYAFNYQRFIEITQSRVRTDGILDPHDPKHIGMMARLLSTRLVYGEDSEEYRKQLKDFNDYRTSLVGTIGLPPSKPSAPTETSEANGACGSDNSQADQLWANALQLEKEGRFEAALAALKQSVALCPDAERSARIAPLHDKMWIAWAEKVGANVKKAIPDVKEPTLLIGPAGN